MARRTRQQKYPDNKYFHFHNENPKNRFTGDCRIRALATACERPYNQIVMDLAVIQIKTGYDQTQHDAIAIELDKLGWTMHKQPRKWDNTKYTVKEFIDEFVERDKRYFVGIAGHDFAIVDGKAWDIWDVPRLSHNVVGNYWTKD